MSRGPDAGALLERALLLSANGSGIDPIILSADWTRWASATFIGARHRITLCVAPSPALDRWLAALPEAAFSLNGHLVADLVVKARRAGREGVAIDVEALTVEDG